VEEPDRFFFSVYFYSLHAFFLWLTTLASVWLEGPKFNAVPYRVFVTKGKPSVVAAIVISDDKQFYLVYSKDIQGMVRDLLLPSPFLDKTRKKYLVFRVGKRKVKSTGYLIAARSKYELDLFTEEVRYLIASAIDKPIKVRKLKSEEEIPKITKSLTEEERRIYELAPVDVPTELEEDIADVGEEIIVENLSEHKDEEELDEESPPL
jgi:hypothetical protein